MLKANINHTSTVLVALVSKLVGKLTAQNLFLEIGEVRECPLNTTSLDSGFDFVKQMCS